MEIEEGKNEDLSSFDERSCSDQDDYNINLAVTVTEIDGEEINNEFLDALVEIEGKKEFRCSNCDKVCRSKGGLTKHTNAKHLNALPKNVETATSLSEEMLSSMVDSIKDNLIKKKLYGSSVIPGLNSASSGTDLFKAVLPLYELFVKKHNSDQLLESFYGLIPQSCELLDCEDFRAANLMIHLPDHLVGFYNTTQATERCMEGDDALLHPTEQLNPAESGPLSYISGYVVFKLIQMNKNKVGKENEDLQALLLSMKSTEGPNNFISNRTRGGLVNPCQDLIGILEQAECFFRKSVKKEELSLRNIPTDTICIEALQSPMVKSLWSNIVLSSGVDQSCSTQKVCLENIISLYLRIRSFSYARDYVNKYKIKVKEGKRKALRKDMKSSNLSKT